MDKWELRKQLFRAECRAEKERKRAEDAEAERDRLRSAALEVAAFRAQVTHGDFDRASLLRAMERLECALRNQGGDNE